MERIQHDLVQGSDEWHQFRLEHDGASEAAAALGLQLKKTTRAKLMFAKHTGIAREFSRYVQEEILDGGHEAEALARPIIEEMIGESLYAVTYSYGRMSASCDGLTASDQVAMEHKRWNKELAASVAAGILPDEYMPQCQQVMYVTGAEKLLFVCSDGTRENMVSMWVYPDQAWVDRIIAGWDQFHRELETYTPQEVIPAAVARPTLDLPIPLIEASGAIAIQSNLTEFGRMLNAFIENIPKKPDSDQDFADCKAALTKLKAAEDALDAGEARALAQLTDIDAMRREKKLYFDLSRTTRLALEKLVVEREKAIKVEIMQAGREKLTDHIATLNKRLATAQMPEIPADFAAAIKGKRTVTGLRDGVEALVTQKILEASAIADKIQININELDANKEYAFLFNDRATLLMKANDDLKLVIRMRISDHLAAEERRLVEEREKIRAEEEAKAAAEAKIKADQIAREQAEANEMAMQEIMGINQQVIIAQTGRLGVRAGGTIQCIRETLAETEAWVIGDRFGALIGSAQAAKDRAIASIRELLAKAEQKAIDDEAAQQRAAAEAAAAIERDRAATATSDLSKAGAQLLVDTINQFADNVGDAPQIIPAGPAARVTRSIGATSTGRQFTTAINPALVAEKSSRPSDAMIIGILSAHYRVHESKVVEWLLDMDLKAASDNILKEFAA